MLLPRPKVVAVMGDAYHLVSADDPRPDFTTCQYKHTEEGYDEVSLLTHGPTEFADAKAVGPKDYFLKEERLALCPQDPRDGVLTALGLEARVCGKDNAYRILVRRPTDVLVLYCVECTREQAIALARAALR